MARDPMLGEGKAKALRQAQLAMKAEYPDPYYWGAFVCLGDPGPINWSDNSLARD